MKYYIIITSLLIALSFQGLAQTKSYKDYEICTDSAIYKGKINHGKFHCIGSIIVRKYKNGTKDTIAWMPSGQIFIGDEYEQYKKLTDRGKYIIDSLKEDGLPQFEQSYLTYEPIYMKKGKKSEWFWSIIGKNVVLYQYSIWHYDTETGFQLLKEITIK